MAPMAGRVADAEEDRFVFLAGFRESFLAPGKPIDGVGLMLQQGWRFFACQPVGMRMRSRHRFTCHNTFLFGLRRPSAVCHPCYFASKSKRKDSGPIH